MDDRLPYDELPKGLRTHWRPGKADPRLVALARFLGRRAAERDYRALLEARKDNHGEVTDGDR